MKCLVTGVTYNSEVQWVPASNVVYDLSVAERRGGSRVSDHRLNTCRPTHRLFLNSGVVYTQLRPFFLVTLDDGAEAMIPSGLNAEQHL